MQIVRPIDIEDALRTDLKEYLPKIAIHSTPAPDDIKANSVCITALGGVEQSAVSHEYDLSIDVWSSTPGKAIDLANIVYGIISSIDFRAFLSGRQYHFISAVLPYQNPDMSRPKLPRCTFSATVSVRGISIEL